jgi:hypothetical protein
MKSKLALGFFAVLSLALLPGASLAKNANQDNSGQDKSAKVRKVSGCLAKGDGETDYQLTADNGATWEVKSDAVNFAPHVGHTVTVTGTVDNATMHGAKEKAKAKTEDNPIEHGHLTVTNMKMVSESCSR